MVVCWWKDRDVIFEFIYTKTDLINKHTHIQIHTEKGVLLFVVIDKFAEILEYYQNEWE